VASPRSAFRDIQDGVAAGRQPAPLGIGRDQRQRMPAGGAAFQAIGAAASRWRAPLSGLPWRAAGGSAGPAPSADTAADRPRAARAARCPGRERRMPAPSGFARARRRRNRLHDQLLAVRRPEAGDRRHAGREAYDGSVAAIRFQDAERGLFLAEEDRDRLRRRREQARPSGHPAHRAEQRPPRVHTEQPPLRAFRPGLRARGRRRSRI